MHSIEEWRYFFLSRGIASDLIERYLEQASLLSKTKSPIIFELEHLSLLVGVKYKVLLNMIHGSSSYYRTFSIKKRAGGSRKIEAPYPSLLQCQTWIYHHVLLKNPVHDCAHGYVPGRSIFTNATAHLGCKTLLKMDLKDFFPSIGIGWVVKFFTTLGYTKNVAYALGALCCNQGRLVQGASTSPYLTNILLYDLDDRLFKLASRSGLSYTRYADDLTFSGGYISTNFVSLVSRIASEFSLVVNNSKTRLLIEKNKKIVTGLSVSGSSLRITREMRRSITQDVFYIEKYGLFSHVSQMKITDPFYLESIAGKVAFWIQAEPQNATAHKCRDILSGYFTRTE